MKYIAIILLFIAQSCQKPIKNENSSSYVFTWVKDENDWNSDYVAVINSDPKDRGYGSLVSTLPVGFNDINAHHSEHRFHEIKELFVNGFSGGRSFIVDLNDPKHPKLKKTFTNVNQYTFPHSFERLPNGNVLATFQTVGQGNNQVGGLVEISSEGDFVRSSNASDPKVAEFIRPYSLAILPEIDRVVSTSADMKQKILATSFKCGV